jgi:heme/copper-type cytochrome/quinol oxidase subunit 2
VTTARWAAWLAIVWLAAPLVVVAEAGGRAGGSSLELAPPALEIRVSRDGFQPAELRLHKDETTRLALRSEDEEHCFAVDEFRIEKRVRPGQVTHVELTPDRAGRFTFYCCLEPAATRHEGTLIVSE